MKTECTISFLKHLVELAREHAGACKPRSLATPSWKQTSVCLCPLSPEPPPSLRWGEYGTLTLNSPFIILQQVCASCWEGAGQNYKPEAWGV